MSMKKFDETKYTEWFITENGDVFSESSYNNRNGISKRKASENKKRGYLYVRTPNGNYAVHRLVAKYFISNPINKSCVNHKDSNRLNNRVENLEWVTHSENTQHAIGKGRIKLLKKNEGANIKYSNLQCLEVIERVYRGMTYAIAGSIHSMPYSTVAHLIRKSRRSL
jgi:hypothetical protein